MLGGAVAIRSSRQCLLRGLPRQADADHESSPMAARYRRPDDPRRGEGDLILAAIASDSG